MAKENKEWKNAKQKSFLKFEKDGDYIEGKYIDIEESTKFPESYLVTIKLLSGEVSGVFVSKMVKNLIEENNIAIGQEIKITFLGKKKTQDGKTEYNNYKLQYV